MTVLSPTLTIDEVATELGRSATWVYDHWRGLVAAERMPKPLLDGTPPLRWSRAQIYAWIDRDLSREQRIAAAAFRAALAAASETRHAGTAGLLDDSRARLDARFSRSTHGQV